jgi:hypothetical protein
LKRVDGGENATGAVRIDLDESMDQQILRLVRYPRKRDLDLLRRRWDEGKASGCAGRLDIRGLIADERASLEEGKASRS